MQHFIQEALLFCPRARAQDLREANKLWILGKAIAADSVLPELLLHVESPGLIKANVLPLHDTLNLSLSPLIQTRARITLYDVGRQIERARVQAGFHIIPERGRNRVVALEVWDSRETVNPLRTSNKENYYTG